LILRAKAFILRGEGLLRSATALHPEVKRCMTEMRLGVSACLMGDEVRYDGGHRRDPYVMDVLDRYFTLVKVCPEVGVGMSTPRETVRLVGRAEAPRMVASETGSDWTARMNRWSRTRVRELKGEDLCGFVFKKNSPSCGVFGVKIYDDKGRPGDSGSGLFAMEFRKRTPWCRWKKKDAWKIRL